MKNHIQTSGGKVSVLRRSLSIKTCEYVGMHVFHSTEIVFFSPLSNYSIIKSDVIFMFSE
jgi:hypothetical protein